MIKLYQNDNPLYQNADPIGFKTWKFPGGEIGVKLNLAGDPTASYFDIVVTGIPTSDDIFTAINIADAIRQSGVEKRRIGLTIPYLPYARQDRICHSGESFSLEVFIKILATGHWSTITVVDLHSQVAFDLLEQNFDSVYHITQETAAYLLPKFDVLIAPDRGARDKVQQHHQVLYDTTSVVHLDKTRTASGIVYTDYEYDTIHGDVCVVDDLCDGGRTFISVAEMLKRTQPGITSMSLYVTHGIFSAGVTQLKEFYDKIYVYNLMNPDYADSVVQFNQSGN